jgi:hypothetical protein
MTLPQFTFYAYLGPKHWRHPVMTLDKIPTDWLHIALLVKECCISLWNEKHEKESIISLEKHLGGGPYKMLWRKAGYSPRRVYFKRDITFSCKVSFDPHTCKVKISSPSFGPELLFAGCLEDYRRIERGVWRMPSSVIPKADQGICDGDNSTKKLLMQPSASRYGDYSRMPRLIYEEGPALKLKWRSYDQIVKRSYLPKPQQLEEQNEVDADDST